MEILTRRLLLATTYVLAVPILVLYALSVTGCISSTSPGLSQIYLLRLYPKSEEASFVVDIGYFGICINIAKDVQCASSAGKTTDAMMRTFFNSDVALFSKELAAPIDMSKIGSIMNVAIILQSKIIVCTLTVSGVLFVVGLLANLVEVVRHTRRRYGKSSGTQDNKVLPLRKFARAVNWLAVTLALASTLGVAQSTSSLQVVTTQLSASVEVDAGETALGIHWAIVCLVFTFTVVKSILIAFESSAAANGASKGGAANGYKSSPTKVVSLASAPPRPTLPPNAVKKPAGPTSSG